MRAVIPTIAERELIILSRKSTKSRHRQRHLITKKIREGKEEKFQLAQPRKLKFLTKK